MKFLTTLLLLLIWGNISAQTPSDLVGTWKLKTVRDSTEKKCKGIEKYVLIIHPDHTYDMYFGGSSGASGRWEIEGNKIKFDAQSIADPCMEWRVDKEFKSFEITNDGMLVIDMFICSNAKGKSYFKKKKSAA